MELSVAEKLRYGRQMVLAEVGARGQLQWRAAQAQAHDAVEALYLAAAGVGAVTVPNDDVAAQVSALNPLVAVTIAASTAAGGNVESSSLRALTTLCRLLDKR